MANQPKTFAIRRSAMATHVVVARWATLVLILFMLSIIMPPVWGTSIYPAWLMVYIKEEWFAVLALYLIVEFDETQRRLSTDLGGFVSDNGLALLALFVGLAAFVLMGFRQGYQLTYEEYRVIRDSTIVVGFDFYYGIVITQRIASSAKERAEEPAARGH
jgi:hypothetical protein